MRTNLVMHFHCSECGSVLIIVGTGSEKVRSKDGIYQESPKLPTGADLRSVPPIQIVPCRECIEKYTGPSRKLAEAIKALTEGGEGKA